MENKEMKKPIPVELEGEELDNVSGGEVLQYFIITRSICQKCGNFCMESPYVINGIKYCTACKESLFG